MSDAVLIQNAILDRVDEGVFYLKEYTSHRASLGAEVGPPDAWCNEVGAEWAPSRNKMQPGLSDIAGWGFRLVLVFKDEIDSFAFDQDLGRRPLNVRGGDGRLYRVLVRAKEAEHPPRKNPSCGSRLAYEFVVHAAT